MLTRRRFPGTGEGAKGSRDGPFESGGVPHAVVLLSVEELAVNDLRETFHHWVRTVAFPVRKRQARPPLFRIEPASARIHSAPVFSAFNPTTRNLARAIFEDVEGDLKAFVTSHAQSLTQTLCRTDSSPKVFSARQQEEERYRSRQGEVSALIAETTLAKLEREVAELKVKRQQGLLFEESDAARSRWTARSRRSELEIVRRTPPLRRSARSARARARADPETPAAADVTRCPGTAQVFPVSIEIRLPAVEGARESASKRPICSAGTACATEACSSTHRASALSPRASPRDRCCPTWRRSFAAQVAQVQRRHA